MKKDSKIAILGFGIEGRAIADYLHKHGYRELTICDERESVQDLPEHADVQLGVNAFNNLTDFDTVFRSPGIPISRPELRSAIDSGTHFTSVTKFFFENCPGKTIGVSGTKGKGTTSSLTYEILKKAEKDVYLGGNIGEAPVNFLDDMKPDSIAVLELSSFQLEDLKQSPNISIVLNITRDHLDYHANVDEYQEAKRPLLKYQTGSDLAIINADYEGSRKFGELGDGKKYWYSSTGANKAAAGKADAGINGADIIILGKKVADIKDISLRGTHNYENVLPACLAATLLGVDENIIKKALREFKGLPHRLEFVCEKNGVQYFNDSFSTTPETSMAGIRAFKEPLYLIAGGSEKHSDFTKWAEACAKAPNLKMVLLMGDTADRMEDVLQDAIQEHPREETLDIVRIHNLEDAFAFLANQTKSGDIVLMSPACASFGLFTNYKERGQAFKTLAKGERLP